MNIPTCPYCGCKVMEGERVDVGVGGPGMQVQPNFCELCHAVEIGPFDKNKDKLTKIEQATGYYEPQDPAVNMVEHMAAVNKKLQTKIDAVAELIRRHSSMEDGRIVEPLDENDGDVTETYESILHFCTNGKEGYSWGCFHFVDEETGEIKLKKDENNGRKSANG